MKLESLILAVRPRTPWEAMDLAVRLLMSNWRLLLSSWMVTVLPLFVIINISLLNSHPMWAFFLCWWLKPLYDRIPLFVLSRIIFAQDTSYRDVLRALPELLKTGVFASLTFYRLDPGRAFSLPIRQLEGLKGKSRRQRLHTLQQGASNRELIFFILCFHLETLIYIGLIALFLIMLPNHLSLQGAQMVFLNEQPGLLLNSLSMMFYFIVMMLVETLYVAGGFMLYINRRVILEGWDIELVFRKMAVQSKQKQLLSSIMLPLLGGALLVCTLGVTDVQAASDNASAHYEKLLPPMAESTLAADSSAKIIKQVMADPVFERFKQVEQLKYIGKKNKKNKSLDYLWLTDAMENIGQTLASIFEIILWVILLVVVFLLIKYRQRLHLGFSSRKKIRQLKTQTLFGMDIRQESLPEDVSADALKLYQQQDYRAALALLYRATLAYLVNHHHFNLAAGATEGDCLAMLSSQLSLSAEQVNYFKQLSKAWQLTAYAHRTISAQHMQQLCHDWQPLYDSVRSDDERLTGQHNE